MIPKQTSVANLALLAGFLIIQAPGFAQALGSVQPQAPAFEVATIKAAPPLQAMAAQIMSGKIHLGMRVEGDRVDIGGMPLSALIQTAYRVKPYQVSGPSWLTDQRYDILAKMPEGASRDLVPEMLQALLAERFKLTVHRDHKEHPMYALVVAKGGSKLIPSPAPEPEAPAGPDASHGSITSGNGLAIDTPNGKMSVSVDMKSGGAVVNSPQTGKMRMSVGPDRTMTMEAERMTLSTLAEQLSVLVDRPVIDLTDLKGNYQVKLELSMENLMQAAKGQGFQMPMMPGPGRGDGAAGAGGNTASDPSGGGSIFESVQKLGLRLEPRKMPVDLIVVDSAEKAPTEN